MINPMIPKLIRNSYQGWFITEIRTCHILEKNDYFNKVDKPTYTHNK